MIGMLVQLLLLHMLLLLQIYLLLLQLLRLLLLDVQLDLQLLQLLQVLLLRRLRLRPLLRLLLLRMLLLRILLGGTSVWLPIEILLILIALELHVTWAGSSLGCGLRVIVLRRIRRGRRRGIVGGSQWVAIEQTRNMRQCLTPGVGWVADRLPLPISFALLL